MMDSDMFCYIHEGGELVKDDDGDVKYNDGHTIYIEIVEHMSHDEFRLRVCDILNIQSYFVNLNS